MLIVKGYDYRRVVDTLADRYGVAPATIETDIHRMDDWLPRLTFYDDDDGLSRILELQVNRQRLQKMATEARKEGKPRLELKIRNRIERSVELEIEVSQSLGRLVKAPEKIEADIRERAERSESESYAVIEDDDSISSDGEQVTEQEQS